MVLQMVSFIWARVGKAGIAAGPLAHTTHSEQRREERVREGACGCERMCVCCVGVQGGVRVFFGGAGVLVCRRISPLLLR